MEAGRAYPGVEFLDVGAGDEGPAGAAEHDRFDLRPTHQVGEGFLDPGPHRAIHRVDGRIVDLDHGDAVDDRIADDLTHVSNPCRRKPVRRPPYELRLLLAGGRCSANAQARLAVEAIAAAAV